MHPNKLTFLNSILHFSTHPPLQNYWQHFYAIFFDNFFPPGRCFSTSIKCIQYSLLLIENYSQVIFYNLRQYSTQFDNIRIVYCIHGYISPQNVEAGMKLSKYVEVCRISVDLIFPFIIIIPLYMKIIQRIVRQMSTKFTVFIIAHFNWNVK